jgi:hypothetical protein
MLAYSKALNLVHDCSIISSIFLYNTRTHAHTQHQLLPLTLTPHHGYNNNNNNSLILILFLLLKKSSRLKSNLT